MCLCVSVSVCLCVRVCQPHHESRMGHGMNFKLGLHRVPNYLSIVAQTVVVLLNVCKDFSPM